MNPPRPAIPSIHPLLCPLEFQNVYAMVCHTSITAFDTMGSLRWTLKDLKKTAVVIPDDLVAPKVVPQAVNGESGSIEDIINSVLTALPHGEIIAGERVTIHWTGMRLLTLNQMLRTDHRKLHGYRCACHDAVRSAVLGLAKRSHGLMFRQPVRVTIERTGVRLMDTDGLYASFKFIIDGFRAAKVIRDDDPMTITHMNHRQSIGKPEVGIEIASINE